jgi:N4-(beta-N-acetylglucosaminyl)-L-asparaginase
MSSIGRREFVRTTAAAGLAAALPGVTVRETAPLGAPAVRRNSAVKPIVIADDSGLQFRNGGKLNAVETAFDLITKGSDVLDALIAGVNIPELDPLETGIGYGGLPNADGVVQLDASVMHGPKRRAGGVAAIEGVRTPSLVAKAVAEQTDHHLLVGEGAQAFARAIGITVEDDLNTPESRKQWLEWKRRVDPEHWLDPSRRTSEHVTPERGYDVGLAMVRDGLIPEGSFWGTINCNAINANGDICGVTTTSGLAFKIPGRVGDSPILGAGLYVDNDVGAAGSTGRGEANLYNLSSYLIVEGMRRGLHPKDAGMQALRRIRSNTVEQRLRNAKGEPNFNVRFFVLDRKGQYAGVTMYAWGEKTFAFCDENGARALPLEPLLPGTPTD